MLQMVLDDQIDKVSVGRFAAVFGSTALQELIEDGCDLVGLARLLQMVKDLKLTSEVVASFETLTGLSVANLLAPTGTGEKNGCSLAAFARILGMVAYQKITKAVLEQFVAVHKMLVAEYIKNRGNLRTLGVILQGLIDSKSAPVQAGQ